MALASFTRWQGSAIWWAPGQGRVKDLAVETREVEDGLGPVEAPVTVAPLQPGDWLVAVATRNDVEQLTGGNVHEGGAKARAATFAVAHVERLVATRRLDEAEAVIVVLERLAVAHERVVDGMPITTELVGDLLDAAAVTADLAGEPAPG